jgi:hypothetical protein
MELYEPPVACLSHLNNKKLQETCGFLLDFASYNKHRSSEVRLNNYMRSVTN